tara:strand:+ start:182 stop:286 length:105 start_codon:yes stop_codon:yes gene_type:complete
MIKPANVNDVEQSGHAQPMNQTKVFNSKDEKYSR